VWWCCGCSTVSAWGKKDEANGEREEQKTQQVKSGAKKLRQKRKKKKEGFHRVTGCSAGGTLIRGIMDRHSNEEGDINIQKGGRRKRGKKMCYPNERGERRLKESFEKVF